MELEGFGASLVGRSIYVYANGLDAWIPWEFIEGTPYSCKILITSSDSNNHRCLEIDNLWTIVFRPLNAKDWSCIATILKAMGGSVLLAFDVGCSKAPDSFHTFLHSLVNEGRIVVTRIWVGRDVELPVIPDAIFFPVHILDSCIRILDMLERLPGRNGHSAFKSPSREEWAAMVTATVQSNLGIVVSDIGEASWSLFWHKLGDSEQGEKTQRIQRGISWLKSATASLEKYAL